MTSPSNHAFPIFVVFQTDIIDHSEEHIRKNYSAYQREHSFEETQFDGFWLAGEYENPQKKWGVMARSQSLDGMEAKLRECIQSEIEKLADQRLADFGVWSIRDTSPSWFLKGNPIFILHVTLDKHTSLTVDQHMDLKQSLFESVIKNINLPHCELAREESYSLLKVEPDYNSDEHHPWITLILDQSERLDASIQQKILKDSLPKTNLKVTTLRL